MGRRSRLLAAALGGWAWLLAPGPLPARAEALAGLDLSAVAARVAEMEAATEDGDRKLHRVYSGLGRRLAKPSPRGLPDDLGKVLPVSRACRGPLLDDTDLRADLDAALDEGEDALGAADVAAVTRASLVEDPAGRARVLDAVAKAREKAVASGEARDGGDEDLSIRLAKKAAKGFASAIALADRLHAKELGPPAWSLPLSDLDGALLSVWGTSGSLPELFVVGANDGNGPLFLRLAPGGEAWVRVPAGATGDLWWVTGVPGDGVWAAGTGGTVLRLDPATGAVTDRSTGVDAILYGVWGSGPTDVWAVGGDPDGVGPRPALLHWDGGGWTPFPAPEEADGRMLFKVWGSATDDVWACGQGGLLLHWNGAAWAAVPSGTASTLLTVNGDSPAIAVGGLSAVIVERAPNGTWSPAQFSSPQGGTPGLNGVFVPPDGNAVAVGFSTTVMRRKAGTWSLAAGMPGGTRDLHAVWIDDDGNQVMVGGNLSQLTKGQVVAFGRRSLPSEIVAQAKWGERVYPMLYNNCAISGCHLAPFTNEGLDFTTPQAGLSTTVSVPSRQSPLLRVLPGRPGQSYLLHKVAGTQAAVGGSGDRMPQGEAPLAQADLDAIRAWISEGALDN